MRGNLDGALHGAHCQMKSHDKRGLPSVHAIASKCPPWGEENLARRGAFVNERAHDFRHRRASARRLRGALPMGRGAGSLAPILDTGQHAHRVCRLDEVVVEAGFARRL